jgi:hypothetical protein
MPGHYHGYGVQDRGRYHDKERRSRGCRGSSARESRHNLLKPPLDADVQHSVPPLVRPRSGSIAGGGGMPRRNDPSIGRPRHPLRVFPYKRLNIVFGFSRVISRGLFFTLRNLVDTGMEFVLFSCRFPIVLIDPTKTAIASIRSRRFAKSEEVR